ncbi:hypothetical protein TELCIR_00981 [Teladorsagia circumcincta]|uniref:C-type lectin domain-containing protein n=1 Tax=Teladorsagia circumcincta TaxID=45464 RepID=A0A2G9V354_TELCI|nr:hypothetical protein TELCIR_00981 [Teladorsagia circumcincta]
MFNLICCWLLVLCFHGSYSIDISADTIERLKKGEWVVYPHDDDEERVVKIVSSSSILGNKTFSYDDSERYCTNEDGHLVSIRSEKEAEYLAGHRNNYIKYNI